MSPIQKQYSIFGMQVLQTLAIAFLLWGGSQIFTLVKYIYITVESDHNRIVNVIGEHQEMKRDIQNLQLEDNRHNLLINTLLNRGGTKTNP